MTTTTPPSMPRIEIVHNLAMPRFSKLSSPVGSIGYKIDLSAYPDGHYSMSFVSLSMQKEFLVSVAASPVRDFKSEILVSQHYSYDNYAEVKSFLFEHPTVVTALIQAVPHIERNFGLGTQVVLKISRDYDSNGDVMLIAAIMTTLSAQDALTILKGFDKTWWNSASRGLRNDLVFDVDFI